MITQKRRSKLSNSGIDSSENNIESDLEEDLFSSDSEQWELEDSEFTSKSSVDDKKVNSKVEKSELNIATDKELDLTEEEEAIKITNGINRIIKIVALAILIVVVIIVVNQIRAMKKLESDEATRQKYETYLNEYEGALNDGDKDMIQRYFKDQSLISEEFDYFQDGVYKDNSVELIKSILKTVSFDYELTSAGRPNTNVVTNLTVKYIDFEALARSIFEDSTGIRESAKSVKTKTQLDRQILKNFSLKYLADKISGMKVSAEKKCTVNILKYGSKKASMEYISNDFDKELDTLLFENEEINLSYKIITDAIKGKIKQGDSYEEYINKLDKLKTTGVDIDKNNYIKDGQFGVTTKESNGVSKTCGEGTPESMASVGTEMQSIYRATVIKKNKSGKTIKKKKNCKVLISVNKVYSGQDAIDYANSVSNMNRGLSSNLTGKLMIVDYTICNLTKETFHVDNNMGIVDSSGNPFYSTGKVYGVKTEGTLKKNGSLNLQFYILCDNIETKYLIYGVDFKKKYPYVWFNCVQSCFGDGSENTEAEFENSNQ